MFVIEMEDPALVSAPDTRPVSPTAPSELRRPFYPEDLVFKEPNPPSELRHAFYPEDLVLREPSLPPTPPPSPIPLLALAAVFQAWASMSFPSHLIPAEGHSSGSESSGSSSDGSILEEHQEGEDHLPEGAGHHLEAAENHLGTLQLVLLVLLLALLGTYLFAKVNHLL